VTWRLEIDGHVGAAVWWLPDERDAPPVAAAADVPVPLRVEAGPIPVDLAPLGPGSLLPVPRLRLTAAGRTLHPLAWADGGLRATGPVPEDDVTLPSLETLPVALTLEVGTLVLPAGEVAALAEGQVVPLELPDPPVVRLCAGGRTVAVGILVDDDGRLAVQITRAGE
jgi:flagellar motor switch/type III secretory pathway protein FliN